MLRTLVLNLWQACREWWYRRTHPTEYMGESWIKEFYEGRKDMEDDRKG